MEAEHLVRTALLQIVVIIIAARIVGQLFRRYGQPQVCGEIAAGLVLGPSLLGGLFPDVLAAVFDPSVEPVFVGLSQLGLILLLFLVGLEFDFDHLKSATHLPLWISAGGIVVPFTLGAATGHYIHPYVGGDVDRLGFSLIVGLTIAVTALPILGRILIEYGLNRTRLGVIAITAAAIDDVLIWIALLGVITFVTVGLDLGATGWVVLQTVAFMATLMLVVRPIARRWGARLLDGSGENLSISGMAVVLIYLFLAAYVTSVIGIFAIIGAFMAGAVLYDQHALRLAVNRRLSDFVTVFFLPIFFTYTGLRTDVSAVSGTLTWVIAGAVLAVAILSKFGACTLGARLGGMSWRDATSVGLLMNTRALMCLIVINIGYDLGLLSPEVFFILVLMAVVTTFMTVPLLRQLIPDLRAVGSPAPEPEPVRQPTPVISVATASLAGESLAGGATRSG
jgi:Kef-type K+ transport system membrane component KefB